MNTQNEQNNRYIESINYLILLVQDYVGTLPDSSKIAVTDKAVVAVETLKELIQNQHATEET